MIYYLTRLLSKWVQKLADIQGVHPIGCECVISHHILTGFCQNIPCGGQDGQIFIPSFRIIKSKNPTLVPFFIISIFFLVGGGKKAATSLSKIPYRPNLGSAIYFCPPDKLRLTSSLSLNRAFNLKTNKSRLC